MQTDQKASSSAQKHLRLFRDVVQQRSVSRAAHASGITQSAASQQILELERQLGVQLLNRQTRPVTPTHAGRLYLDYCRDVLRREEEFVAALSELRSKTEGEVRIASIYSVGLSELPRVEQEFARRYPLIELRISFCRPQTVYANVEEDLADLGVVSYPEARRGITVLPWRNEPMSVVVPNGHVLAGYESIKAEQLDGRPFIAFDDDLAIRRNIDRYLRDHGVSVNVKRSVDNIETLKACVSSGSGISILPHCTIDRLKAIPLKEPLLRPIGLIHRKGKVLTGAAKLVIEQLLGPSL